MCDRSTIARGRAYAPKLSLSFNEAYHSHRSLLLSSEYSTVNFIQLPDSDAVSAEVVSNGTETYYRIETLSDAIHLYHKGPIAGKRPIVTFQNLAGAGAGEMPTVAFRDKEEKLKGCLLTIHSEWVYSLVSHVAHTQY